eukprot:gb/GEZN01003008.1/.p1 GENE.gb/GEZN01003008.1/~~gb/GEZN01003008.1/.p1  ORF type:complete len:727 (+),score=173.68 gb/GEZN01003008.1/:29-2209(+)
MSGLNAALFDKSCSFSSLNLDTRLFKAAARLKFIYPTIVQARVIPMALAGRDVLVRACTGSGKTLAYVLPVLQQLLVACHEEGGAGEGVSGTQALVLVPTRELCDQVEAQFKSLMYYCDDLLTILALSDRLPVTAQVARLKERPSIVISTPTRLIDYLENNILSLKHSLKLLVVDEADLVLSYGYEDDVKTLLDFLPKLHQSMLLSATLTPEIQVLQGLVLNHPKIFKDHQDTSADRQIQLKEQYIRCSPDDKFLVAYVFLTLGVIKPKTLFFVNSIDRGFRLKLFLEQFSIASVVLNAELPYNSRHSMLQQFNRGIFDILIATDACLEADIEVVADTQGKGVEEEEKEEGGEEREEEKEESGKKKEEEEEEDEEDEEEGEKEEEEGDEEEDEEEGQGGEEGDGVEETNTMTAKQAKAQSKRKRQKQKKQQQQRTSKNALSSGVSRGVDFYNVATVVNFDMPTSVKAYVHRIGRTARGGKSGMALSFVSSQEMDLIDDILEKQRLRAESHGLGADVSLLRMEYDQKAVERFRYRCTDAGRRVTSALVREARLTEIKQEIMNSKKLQDFFQDNPRELRLLRHDRVLKPAVVTKQLATVPDYLLPGGIKESAFKNSKQVKNRKKNIWRNSRQQKQFTTKRKKKDDPLQSFEQAGQDQGSSSSFAAATPSALAAWVAGEGGSRGEQDETTHKRKKAHPTGGPAGAAKKRRLKADVKKLVKASRPKQKRI